MFKSSRRLVHLTYVVPGIAGLFSRQAPAHCEALLDSMLQTMVNETAHVSRRCCFPEIGVYAGEIRLNGSASDPHEGNMGEGDLALLFSGEFFSGNVAAADLDTPVLELFRDRGESAFEQLNGIFSGLLVDLRQKESWLFTREDNHKLLFSLVMFEQWLRRLNAGAGIPRKLQFTR